MSPDVQTWLALAVVAFAAGWLIRRWWKRRGHEHEGCDCPIASGGSEFNKLKKRLGRRP